MKEEYQDIMAMVNDLLEMLEDLDTDDEDVDDAVCDTISQLEDLKSTLRLSKGDGD